MREMSFSNIKEIYEEEKVTIETNIKCIVESI